MSIVKQYVDNKEQISTSSNGSCYQSLNSIKLEYDVDEPEVQNGGTWVKTEIIDSFEGNSEACMKIEETDFLEKKYSDTLEDPSNSVEDPTEKEIAICAVKDESNKDSAVAPKKHESVKQENVYNEENMDKPEVQNRIPSVETEIIDSFEGKGELCVKIEDTEFTEMNYSETLQDTSNEIEQLNSIEEGKDIKYEPNMDFAVAPKKHECPICNYKTADKRSLKRHMDFLHSDSGQFLQFLHSDCPMCDFSSPIRNNLNIHMSTAHPKQFKCYICSFTTTTQKDLKVHIDSSHLEYKENKCHLCDHKSTKKVSLRQHMERVHFKTKQFKCDMCDFVTCYKKYVNAHVQSVHLKLRDYKCQYCDYAAAQDLTLKKHIQSIHLNVRMYKCHLCDYAANQKHKLMMHVNSFHLKLKNYKC